MTTVTAVPTDAPRRARLVLAVWPALAAGCAIASLHAAAPAYLLQRGFPLDDSWIHAVYARELVRSGTLAYNPGIPATGETAPLWAVLLAIPHALASDATTAVFLTKALGCLLHAGSAALLALALAPLVPGAPAIAALAGGLVGLHPDLVAASVSGMEVPLATFVIAATIAAVTRARAVLAALLGAIALVARPETTAMVVIFPAVFWLRQDPRRAARIAAAALAGGVAALVLLGVRNFFISGFFLPATFHAKTHFGLTAEFVFSWLHYGFAYVLGRFPLVNSGILLAVVTVLSALLAWRRSTGVTARAGAALWLTAVSFCAISFAMVRPTDPGAFYHQRYVLPALVPMVAALVLMAYAAFSATRPRVATGATVVIALIVAGILLADGPARYRRLSNDALNIDDVQVAFGRALSSAPPSTVVWVLDAGAPRFFGNAFVVDLVGLNTPAILGDTAQEYLDAHRPHYLDLFPGWSAIEGPDVVLMPRRAFATSTPYTVTSFAGMRQHFLVSCSPPDVRGEITAMGRRFSFRCAR